MFKNSFPTKIFYLFVYCRRQTLDMISDEQLAYVILSTVFAHSVVWDKEREMYRLKMEGFEDLVLFEVMIRWPTVIFS